MVIGTFDIYDILTDIIPGIIATLLVLVLAVPVEAIGNAMALLSGVGGGLILVAVAYVVGRLVRNSGMLHEFVIPRLLANFEPFEEILYRIVCLGDAGVSDEIVELFVERLTAETGVELPRDEGEWEKWRFFETVIPVGYSRLWDKDTLYQRYTIISSFYESIATTFYLSAAAYTVVWIATLVPYSIGYGATLWTTVVLESPVVSVFVVVGMAVTAILSTFQYAKFERRRAIMFVTDLTTVERDV